MRFMVMMKADKDYEAGVPPSNELMAAIGKHTEDGIKAGVVLDTGGLFPSSMGARVHLAGGKMTVTDGPFAETKELVGGYAIIQAKSRAEAIELAKAFMKLHGDVLGHSYEGECEIRQLFDSPDVCPQGNGR